MNMEAVSKMVQVVSVVAGVVVSVLSFNASHQKDLESRDREMEARRAEAAKPFFDLRQKLFVETLKTAAVLATPEGRKEADLARARQRFRELYVAELSMVEPPEVESRMKALAEQVYPRFIEGLTPAELSTYHLAHAFRDAFITEWGLNERSTGGK